MPVISLITPQKISQKKKQLLRQLKIDCMDCNISYKDIAVESGVHPSTISRQLNGRTELSFDTYLAVQVLKEERGNK